MGLGWRQKEGGSASGEVNTMIAVWESLIDSPERQKIFGAMLCGPDYVSWNPPSKQKMNNGANEHQE